LPRLRESKTRVPEARSRQLQGSWLSLTWPSSDGRQASRRSCCGRIGGSRHPEIRSVKDELTAWHERISNAVPLAQEAARDYYNFIDLHPDGLLAELRPSAEKVVEAWKRESEKARERLARIEGEHAAIRGAATLYIANRRPLTAADVPTEYDELPLPSDEALARPY